MVAADHLLAFTERRTALMAGATLHQLRYWQDHHRLIRPEIQRQVSPTRVVKLYGFTEAIDACVIGQFRAGNVPLQQVRRVLDSVHERGAVDALRTVEYAIDSGELFWRFHPSEPWEGSKRPKQYVGHAVLNLQLVRRHIREFPARSPDDLGQIVEQRGVQRGAPCFAGTRIPVSSVRAWFEAGASRERVLAAYPLLEDIDLDAIEPATAIA